MRKKLSEVSPNVAEEWNYKRNGTLTPKDVTAYVNRKVWWKCKTCGHEWEALISSRSYGRGCPKCAMESRKKKLAQPAIGKSLKDLYPDLMLEWNYEKNMLINPAETNPHSGKKVWWRCSVCGNEWAASIHSRTSHNTGCPKCSMELQSSFPEQATFFYLKRDIDGEVINRAKIEVNAIEYELDIYIPSIKIGIEYDGRYWHRHSKAKEENKEKIMQKIGINVLRIKESDKNKFESNIIYYDYAHNKDYNLAWAIKTLEKCIGLSESIIDVKNDSLNIMKLYRRKVIPNNIEDNQELVKEWDFRKNFPLSPSNFTKGSGKKVWWKCSICGHEWESAVQNRSRGHGCPECAKKEVGKRQRTPKKGKSLAELHPEIVKEWNFERNNLSPDKVKCSSQLKAWWKCENGHEWEAVISNRVANKTKCPYCAGRKILKGYNDMATLRPNLLEEWDFSKNLIVSPYEISAFTHKKVWWKCSVCGHEWQATVLNRSNGHGCPQCGNKKRGTAKATPHRGQSFADVCKMLLVDWDYEKNAVISPYNVKPHSGKKVWWKCSICGYEWQATVGSRSSGNKCPQCHSKMENKNL